MDPFRHHPGLRNLVEDCETSFFRSFHPQQLDDVMAEQGHPPTWRYTDEERNACLRQTLEGRDAGDLWIFAYGSLMWNPAMRFTEVRRAHAQGVSRRFCLIETLGGRGTAEAPGLLAGLAEADGEVCHGLVFRIADPEVAQETDILWRRERFRPGYHPVFIDVSTEHGPVTALTFVADETAPDIDLALPRERQIQMLATGEGFLGSSMQYIANLAEHLTEMRIEDAELFSLLADARAHAATLKG